MLEEGGVRFAVLSYAWQTPKGKQLAQMVVPHSVNRESPAYKAALDEITAAWKAGFAYQPAAPAG